MPLVHSERIKRLAAAFNQAGIGTTLPCPASSSPPASGRVSILGAEPAWLRLRKRLLGAGR